MPFDGTYLDFDNTCTIQRKATGSAGATAAAKAANHNRTDTGWSALATGVRCKRMQASARRVPAGVVAAHRVLLPYGTDVTAKDRIVVDGLTLQGEFHDPNPGGAEHHCEWFGNEVRV